MKSIILYLNKLLKIIRFTSFIIFTLILITCISFADLQDVLSMLSNQDDSFNILQQVDNAHDHSKDLAVEENLTNNYTEINSSDGEAYAKDSLKEHVIDSEANQPFYKNPYFIGAIGLICLFIVIMYIGGGDSGDGSSALSSSSGLSSTSTTAVQSPASSGRTTPTLVNVPINVINFIPNHITFREALNNIYDQDSQLDLVEYLPLIGNSYSIDSELISYLRRQAESNSLDLAILYNIFGTTTTNVFNNQAHYLVMYYSWNPSEIYPTFDLFVLDMLQQINNFNIGEID